MESSAQRDPAELLRKVRTEAAAQAAFTLRTALQAVAHNKLRAALTSLGILFGVASVIAMLAIGNGAEQEILAQMQLLGTNNVVVTPVVEQKEGKATDQPEREEKRRVENTTDLSRAQAAQGAHFAALEFMQAARMLEISAKADTVGSKRFEVAKNRYVIGKIDISDLYIAQSEKDAALESYMQALRNYWLSYYRLRRLTLYDFAEGHRIEP